MTNVDAVTSSATSAVSGQDQVFGRGPLRRGQDMRPKTLADVARLAQRGDSFDRCLANFLDEFKTAPSAAALSPVPAFLAPSLGETGCVQDAYLAATAEHLAYLNGMPIPHWVTADERKLRLPWFASKLAALRAVLILESPAAFRSRNLFVSENALTRA